MALQYTPPPDWLIQAYNNQKQPAEIVNEGIGNAIQGYAASKQQQQQQMAQQQTMDLQKQQMQLAQQKQATEGRSGFYKYGDPSGLALPEQAMLNPAEGPMPEGQDQNAHPLAAYDPSNPGAVAHAEFLQNFAKRYPQGMEGEERGRNRALQQSEIDKNNAMAASIGKKPVGGVKPQLRQNAFTGEWEWHQPPGAATQEQGGEPSPGGVPGGSHGPGTFRERSKAAGAFAEDQAMVNGVISEIDRVKELNKNSRGGITGSALQKTQSALNMGTNSPEFKNTADVTNTLRGAVSRVLKSTFGGQLSDSEREYLNQVYGAAEKLSPSERDIAMTNVSSMLRNKVRTSGAKYGALTGAQPLNAPSAAAGNSRPTVSNQEQYNALPSGSEYLSPDGRPHRKK